MTVWLKACKNDEPQKTEIQYIAVYTAGQEGFDLIKVQGVKGQRWDSIIAASLWSCSASVYDVLVSLQEAN